MTRSVLKQAAVIALMLGIALPAVAQVYDLTSVPKDQWGEEYGHDGRHVWTHPKGLFSLATPPEWGFNFITPRTEDLSLVQIFSPRDGGPARVCTLMRVALPPGAGTYNSFGAAQGAQASVLPDFSESVQQIAQDIYPGPETKITLKDQKRIALKAPAKDRTPVMVAQVDLTITKGHHGFLLRGIGLDLADDTALNLICVVGDSDAAWLDDMPSLLKVHSAVLKPADQ